MTPHRIPTSATFIRTIPRWRPQRRRYQSALLSVAGECYCGSPGPWRVRSWEDQRYCRAHGEAEVDTIRGFGDEDDVAFARLRNWRDAYPAIYGEGTGETIRIDPSWPASW